MSSRPMPSSAGGLARLFWMLVGPMLLVLLAADIALRSAGWFTPIALAYFLILVGMLLARWVEFRAGEALTSTGEPLTPGELRRYLLVAPVVGVAVWVLANLAGSSWLGR